MQVCVSDDYELGLPQSVPFGGFFSCNTGNPLAAKKAADGAKGSNGMSPSFPFLHPYIGSHIFPSLSETFPMLTTKRNYLTVKRFFDK